MTKIALVVLIVLGITSMAQAGKDICESWTDKVYPVTMQACSYENGKSGYTTITNNGKTSADVSWTVVYKNGKKDKGRYSSLRPGKSGGGSCAQCGTKNGGVQYIVLDDYVVDTKSKLSTQSQQPIYLKGQQ